MSTDEKEKRQVQIHRWLQIFNTPLLAIVTFFTVRTFAVIDRIEALVALHDKEIAVHDEKFSQQTGINNFMMNENTARSTDLSVLKGEYGAISDFLWGDADLPKQKRK